MLPGKIPPSVGYPDLSIKKTLRRVCDLLTILISKVMDKSIFFQINKFTACEFKDKKEAPDCLRAFNLMEVIHLFQGKNYLRT